MGRVPSIWTSKPADDERQFSVDFTLTFDDQYAARHLRSELTFPKYLGAVGAIVLLCALAVAYQQWQAGSGLFAAGAIVLVIPVSYFLAWASFGFVKGLTRGFWYGFFQKRGMINRPITLHMNPSGYSMEAGSHNIHSGWDKVLAVEEDAERYFLFYEQEYVYIVPKRSFETEELAAIDAALHDWCSGKFRETRRS